MSSFDLVPAFQEYTDLLFSTHQRGESSWLSNIQATGGTALAEHVVYVHGLADATQRLCSQLLALKIPLHQAMRRVTDGNSIRRSQSFNARSNIGHFTQCQLFLTPLPTHLPHHDQPRMHPDTDGEVDPCGVLQTCIQVAQRSKHP